MNQISKQYPPRGELLNWLNTTIKEHEPSFPTVNKVEDLGNGVAFCRLFAVMYPGTIQLNKLNPKAKVDHENIRNLKLLNLGMLKAKLSKYFDVKNFLF